MKWDYLLTGFAGLDALIGGFCKGRLIIIAGRPGFGKTSLALSIAANVTMHAEKPVPTAIFTLEMSKNQLSNRIACCEAEIAFNDIQTGKISRKKKAHLSRTVERLVAAPLYIDDTTGIDVKEFRSKAMVLKKKHNVGLIFIDYLQLMNGTKNVMGHEQRVSQIIFALKAAAKELNITVVVLSQIVQRLEMPRNHRPLLSDFRPAAIEQNADIVIFIYRDICSKPAQDKGPAEIIVAKNHNGPIGTVQMSFQQRFGKFGCIDIK